MFHSPILRRALVTIASLAIFAPPVAAATQSGTTSNAATAHPVTKSALSSQLDASFKRLDSNSDKSLTTAEIDAAQKRQMAEAQNSIAKRLEAEFAKLDGNKHVSKSELIQGVEKHIASLPLFRKTEARDRLDWGDGDIGDDY